MRQTFHQTNKQITDDIQQAFVGNLVRTVKNALRDTDHDCRWAIGDACSFCGWVDETDNYAELMNKLKELREMEELREDHVYGDYLSQQDRSQDE